MAAAAAAAAERSGGRAVRTRRGQAAIEAAVGMFVFTLVVVSICSFAKIIRNSLDLHSELRAQAGVGASGQNVDTLITVQRTDNVDVEAFAAEHIFGEDNVKVRVKVALPGMKLQ